VTTANVSYEEALQATNPAAPEETEENDADSSVETEDKETSE